MKPGEVKNIVVIGSTFARSITRADTTGSKAWPKGDQAAITHSYDNEYENLFFNIIIKKGQGAIIVQVKRLLFFCNHPILLRYTLIIFRVKRCRDHCDC